MKTGSSPRQNFVKCRWTLFFCTLPEIPPLEICIWRNIPQVRPIHPLLPQAQALSRRLRPRRIKFGPRPLLACWLQRLTPPLPFSVWIIYEISLTKVSKKKDTPAIAITNTNKQSSKKSSPPSAFPSSKTWRTSHAPRRTWLLFLEEYSVRIVRKRNKKNALA